MANTDGEAPARRRSSRSGCPEDRFVGRRPRGPPTRAPPAADDARRATQVSPHECTVGRGPHASTGGGSRTTCSCRARWTISRRRRTATRPRCRASTSCSTSSRRAATRWRRSILGSLLTGRMTRPARTTGRGRCCSRSASRSRTRSAARSGAPAASATGATSASSATCRTPTGRVVLPMSGDVGSQYTPAAGLGAVDRVPPRRARRPRVGQGHRRGARRRRVGGDERLLVGADDGDHAEAADAVLHRGQRARHLGAGRHADAGRQHREEPGVVRQPVRARRRRHRPA